MNNFIEKLNEKLSNVPVLKIVKISSIVFLYLVIIVGFFIYQTNKSTSLSGMISLGEKHEQKGRLVNALEMYTKAVKNYPSNINAHIKLGQIYQKLDEPQKAKAEFYQVIKMTKGQYHEAYFLIAQTYEDDKEYELANEFLKQIKPLRFNPEFKQMGDFYKRWGDFLLNRDIYESVRKYKIAYDYYKKGKSAEADKIQNYLIDIYLAQAEVFLQKNNFKEALDILQSTLQTFDSPKIHYALASIYGKKDIDKSILHFETAFEKDENVGDKSELVKLFLAKGDDYAKKNDKITADYYYKKALKYNPKTKTPYFEPKNIIVQLQSSKFTEIPDKNEVFPGISFKIMNAGKTDINFLGCKIIFRSDSKILDVLTSEIATEKTPLFKDCLSPEITIYSRKSVSTIFKNKKITAEIQLLSEKDGEWKIFRTTQIER
ncbi:MAG: hypothetical protein PHV68_03395 [Candidatus Gastranaerophilales bacterium]|nr:hypothetical protein [Candidatus Gastranaerophilales bacterium]